MTADEMIRVCLLAHVGLDHVNTDEFRLRVDDPMSKEQYREEMDRYRQALNRLDEIVDEIVSKEEKI